MKRQKWLGVLVAGCLLGSCRTHEDFVYPLRFEGQVTNQQGEPVGGVEVYFVDAGLDEYRRNHREERRVGTTDPQGRLLTLYKYAWGYTYTAIGRDPDPREKVPGTFEVVLKRQNLVLATHKYQLWKLRNENDSYVVPMSAVVKGN